MYTPYNKDTASLEDRIAWALCQIIDDDAPTRWTRYRSAAVCIAGNPELMADLVALSNSNAGVPAAPAPKADADYDLIGESGVLRSPGVLGAAKEDGRG